MRAVRMLLAMLCLAQLSTGYSFSPTLSSIPAQKFSEATPFRGILRGSGAELAGRQKRTRSAALSLAMVDINPQTCTSIVEMFAASRMALELDEDEVWVDMNNVLGSGTFGDVYEAVIVRGPRKGTRAVAKRAKTRAMNAPVPPETDQNAGGTTAARTQQAWEEWCETVFETAPGFLKVESYINNRCATLCPQVVAPYLGAVEQQDNHWLLWEHAGGSQTLENLLEACHEAGSLQPLARGLGVAYNASRPADLRRVVNEAARQLLVCCVELQKAGIAHRDIKPENLIVAHHQMLLIDFGAAAVMGDTPMIGYNWSEAPGDVKYCPPERFIDELEWTKYDVYHVGLILWRMLMPPFRSSAGYDQFRKNFRAGGFDIDTWFAWTVLEDPELQTVQGKNRTQVPDFGFGHVKGTDRMKEYSRLAGLSCVMNYDLNRPPPTSLCHLQEGLSALSNDHVDGLVWDMLHCMIQPEPSLRPTAGDALRQLGGERSKGVERQRGQHRYPDEQTIAESVIKAYTEPTK